MSLMSTDGRSPPCASGGVAYRMLRELGARAQHSYAAIREPNELVVVQTFVRASPTTESSTVHATSVDATSMALLLRDARCLAKNWHPNIGLVRHVDLLGGELTIASELLDGATLADLFVEAGSERTSPRDPLLPLPIVVRILLDVLAGLHALHGLRDAMNAPLGAIHGELCPSNIVVGKDGVARIIDVLRPRPVRLEDSSAAAGYAAPEAFEVGGTSDPRADIYAVGVILWEALAARRLHDETVPAQVLARQREEDIMRPEIHASSPFARLVDVAMRALAFDPALRFRGPAEMASELRKVAGPRLAAGSAIAALVTDLAGERIRTRRALLDPSRSGTRRRVSEGSIAAATTAVRERETTRDLAAAAYDEPPNMPPRPALSPPVPRRSGMVKASPRIVAPTLQAEVSDALLEASRESVPGEEAPLERVADARDIETRDEELAGPRGSTPEPECAPLETPGELSVPIYAIPAEQAPRRRLGWVLLALTGAIVLLASGASVALRVQATRRAEAETAVVAAPPAPAPEATEAVMFNEIARPKDAPLPSSAPAPASSARPSAGTAARPSLPRPPVTAPARPKRSVYDPGGP